MTTASNLGVGGKLNARTYSQTRNKWAIVVFLGFDDNGDRKYKWFSGYDTKKAAEKDLPAKLQEVNAGFIDMSKDTLGAYLESWLEDKKGQVRPGTFRSYEWLVIKHIIPHIGKHELSKVKPIHLQKLYTKLQELNPPISNRSILHAHRIIHQALDRAIKWGMISRNVAAAVDPPRPKNVEIQTWSEAELARFLIVAKSSQYYMVYLLAISTGMRLGEYWPFVGKMLIWKKE